MTSFTAWGWNDTSVLMNMMRACSTLTSSERYKLRTCSPSQLGVSKIDWPVIYDSAYETTVEIRSVHQASRFASQGYLPLTFSTFISTRSSSIQGHLGYHSFSIAAVTEFDPLFRDKVRFLVADFTKLPRSRVLNVLEFRIRDSRYFRAPITVDRNRMVYILTRFCMRAGQVL